MSRRLDLKGANASFVGFDEALDGGPCPLEAPAPEFDDPPRCPHCQAELALVDGNWRCSMDGPIVTYEDRARAIAEKG